MLITIAQMHHRRCLNRTIVELKLNYDPDNMAIV